MTATDRSRTGLPRPLMWLAGPHGRLQLAVALFGTTGLFGKLVDLSPSALVLGRAAVAAVFIAVAARATGRSLRLHRPVDVAAFGVMGGILALHWVAFYHSIQVSTVSVALIAVATFPLFTSIGSPVAAGRWPRPRDIGYAALAFGGVAVIVGGVDSAVDGAVSRAVDSTASSTVDGGVDVTGGVIWGMTAAALFALLTVLNERLIVAGDEPDKVGYSGHAIACFQFGAAALVLAPFAAGEVTRASPRDWVLILILGSVLTGVPHTIFISIMRHITAAAASLAVTMEPVYGVFLAWLILAETPGWRVAAGGVIVLAAVALGLRGTATETSSGLA